MKKIFMFLVVCLLSGCFVANDFERINKTRDRRAEASEGASKSLQESFKFQSQFMACMKDYGKVNAASTTSVSEIAVEAAGSCNTLLQYYSSYRDSYYLRKSIAMNEDYRYYSENNQYKTRNDVDNLVTEGKQATISEIVKSRANKR